jgi:hypothetical protein
MTPKDEGSPAITLYLATLDGATPAAWEPWNDKVALATILAKYEVMAYPIPNAHQYDDIFRVRVIVDADEKLYERSNWSDFVGVVVNPTEPGVLDKHKKYLGRLAKSSAPRYRRVGYYIVATMTGHEPSADPTDRIGELMGQARDRLDTEPRFVWAPMSGSFPPLLHSIALGAISSNIKTIGAV